MRLHRALLLGLPLAAAALAACGSSDKVVTETRPPLAGVRYINAVPDTGRLDIKMIDQLAYSASTNDGNGGIRFREGTRYFSTEAKSRRIRVFSLIDSSVTNVSQVLLDTTVAFEPNKNYTMLLVGSARAAAASADRLRFVRIEDVPAGETNQIQLKVYNATGAAIDASVAAAAPAGALTFMGVAPRSATTYQSRATGAMTVSVASPVCNAGTTAPATTTVAAAAGTAGTATVNPVAGATIAGTVFSAYVFPAAVAGSGAFRGVTATTTPNTATLNCSAVQLFVDRLPPNTVL